MTGNWNQRACPSRKRTRSTSDGHGKHTQERHHRRPRNTRERDRDQAALALADLAVATGCEPTTSQVDILTSAVDVIHTLQGSEASATEEIEELLLRNKLLKMQMAAMRQRLAEYREASSLESNEPAAESNEDPSGATHVCDDTCRRAHYENSICMAGCQPSKPNRPPNF
ncbi:uncharacterized protein LOC126374933 [Pectinophora gossypiella]|uniref:uncharacterized protein LOC126374933 n=1 Tax=Pectinophora gossypiella TaxID=13191 RepID=UPI00214F2A26|nr:uncharacterized protein LOC126374933 [Pectinophora gossypiella]